MLATPDLFAAFRHEFFGPIDQYAAWHDGFQADTRILAALFPIQQTQAAEELVAALRAGIADARALIGLGFLRYEPALPLLRHLLAKGFWRLYVLEAIAAINPAGLWQPLLVRLLAPGPQQVSYDQLIDLLTGLNYYFRLPQLGTAVRRAVFAALIHPEYLVRYPALNAVRSLYGLPTPDHSRHPAG